MAVPSADTDELAKFGYKQKLDRSLGLFSSFADHWYFQWGAFTFTGLLGGVGVIYYLVKHHGRPATVLAEHRAAPAVAVGDEVA